MKIQVFIHFQGKCKQVHPEFELSSPSPFYKTINMTHASNSKTPRDYQGHTKISQHSLKRSS